MTVWTYIIDKGDQKSYKNKSVNITVKQNNNLKYVK